MPILPIDLTQIVTLWIAGAVALTALGGLILHFAVRPVLLAGAAPRGTADAARLAVLERRLAEMEARLSATDTASAGRAG